MSEQLVHWRTGFTGERSLALPLTLRADRGQLYSAQFCPSTKGPTDQVLARLYAPDFPQFDAFLLAQPSERADSEKWPSTQITIRKRGWYLLALDLRQIKDSTGRPSSEIGADCIHIDLALPRGSAQTPESGFFLIDDVEFITAKP